MIRNLTAACEGCQINFRVFQKHQIRFLGNRVTHLSPGDRFWGAMTENRLKDDNLFSDNQWRWSSYDTYMKVNSKSYDEFAQQNRAISTLFNVVLLEAVCYSIARIVFFFLVRHIMIQIKYSTTWFVDQSFILRNRERQTCTSCCFSALLRSSDVRHFLRECFIKWQASLKKNNTICFKQSLNCPMETQMFVRMKRKISLLIRYWLSTYDIPKLTSAE